MTEAPWSPGSQHVSVPVSGAPLGRQMGTRCSRVPWGGVVIYFFVQGNLSD